MNISNLTNRPSLLGSLSSSAFKTLFAGAAAIAVPAAMLATAAPVAAAQSQIDNAVEAIRGISTMKADFVQTDRQGRSVSGVMTLKRPGKIRFEYQKDVNMLIVSNGKSLTMIDYDVNQVQRWPIQDSPLGALLDPKRDIAKYGKLIPTGNSEVISVEVRDPKRPEFGVITMIFIRNGAAPGGWQLTNWVALDSQNNRTTVKLRNHKYGVSVSDKSFTYDDPRQTTRRPR